MNRLKAENALKRGNGEKEMVYEELSEFISDGRSIEDELVAKELGQAINSFVADLPEREGDIFMRRYFFIEPVKDIAEGYGMTAGNVSVTLNRTRKKLKEYLKNNGYL